jgi:hypothetical protein
MVGEEVGAHAEPGHAPELGGIGELAVLQGEAMVAGRLVEQGALEAIERHLGRLVAVGVAVDQHTLLQRELVEAADRLGRRVPQAVGRAVVVAGPAQPGGEALDRAVDEQLDGAEPQPVGRLGLELDGEVDHLLGRQRLEAAERDDAHGEAGFAGDARHHRDRVVRQQVREIGRGGDALAHAELGEAASGRSSSLASASRSKPTWAPTIVIASGPFSSPVGRPSGAEGNAGMVDARPQQAGQLERAGVHVEDVAAGMHHADRRASSTRGRSRRARRGGRRSRSGRDPSRRATSVGEASWRSASCRRATTSSMDSAPGQTLPSGSMRSKRPR